MKVYENITILKPQVSENDITSFIDKTKEYIVKNKGEVLSVENMGMRKLAYGIDKNQEAFYIYIKFRNDTFFVKELEKNLKLDDIVLRTVSMIA